MSYFSKTYLTGTYLSICDERKHTEPNDFYISIRLKMVVIVAVRFDSFLNKVTNLVDHRLVFF